MKTSILSLYQMKNFLARVFASWFVSNSSRFWTVGKDLNKRQKLAKWKTCTVYTGWRPAQFTWENACEIIGSSFRISNSPKMNQRASCILPMSYKLENIPIKCQQKRPVTLPRDQVLLLVDKMYSTAGYICFISGTWGKAAILVTGQSPTSSSSSWFMYVCYGITELCQNSSLLTLHAH